MKHVSIEIIQKCPNECIHCSSVASKECEMFISTQKVNEIIDGLNIIKTEVISISGGEPFLHSGLLEIVRNAKMKGIDVNIYTSGIMFDNQRKECSLDTNIIKDLKKIGVNKLIFNLQSLKSDVYDEIMQTKGNLSLLMESIRKSKENNIFTEIHFVPMQLNINEIDDVVNFVNKLSVDKVSFLGLIPHGRAKINKDRLYLDNETTIKLKAKLNGLANEKVRIGIPLQTDDIGYRCTAGKDKLYIKFDGLVYGCEAFKYARLYDEDGNEIIPDSIHDKKIEEIYTHSEYLKAEEKFICNQQNLLNVSEKCPIQLYIRHNGNK